MTDMKWLRISESGIVSGSVLYGAERISLTGTRQVWKFGRTKNLRRRVKEFGYPTIPRYVLPLSPEDDAVSLERMMHRVCPLPPCGGGREIYQGTTEQVEVWLYGTP